MIHRGDKITRCVKQSTGMHFDTGEHRLRECGLTIAETTDACPEAESGKDMWVHIGCNPRRDKGFDNGDESSPPALRVVPTEWGCKIDREFDEWIRGLVSAPGLVSRV